MTNVMSVPLHFIPFILLYKKYWLFGHEEKNSIAAIRRHNKHPESDLQFNYNLGRWFYRSFSYLFMVKEFKMKFMNGMFRIAKNEEKEKIIKNESYGVFNDNQQGSRKSYNRNTKRLLYVWYSCRIFSVIIWLKE